MIDLTIPKNNERELIDQAKELGYSDIILLYPFKRKNDLLDKRSQLDELSSKINLFTGIYIPAKKISDLKISNQLIQQADFVAVLASEEKIVRSALSAKKKFDAVFNVPSETGRDHTHYRQSNFNQVSANLLKKNKIAYGINFSRLLNNQSTTRAKLWGREAQNIRLVRRKASVIIASFATNKWGLRKPEDLASIAKLLGLTATQAKATVSENIYKILRRKKRQRSPNYIRNGVEIVK